jgi:hypothetical protein
MSLPPYLAIYADAVRAIAEAQPGPDGVLRTAAGVAVSLEGKCDALEQLAFMLGYLQKGYRRARRLTVQERAQRMLKLMAKQERRRHGKK